LFFRELNKSAAPVAPAEERAEEKQEARAYYPIPANGIPSIEVIKADLNKREEMRTVNIKMAAESKEKSSATREKIMDDLKAEAEAPKTIAKKEEQVESQDIKKVTNPTREERERMRARGVIAY
jgi:type IV secretory pathway VirB10-like protein